jgi:hypothetical protein
LLNAPVNGLPNMLIVGAQYYEFQFMT